MDFILFNKKTNKIITAVGRLYALKLSLINDFNETNTTSEFSKLLYDLQKQIDNTINKINQKHTDSLNNG